jgi:hypothetical protein
VVGNPGGQCRRTDAEVRASRSTIGTTAGGGGLSVLRSASQEGNGSSFARSVGALAFLMTLGCLVVFSSAALAFGAPGTLVARASSAGAQVPEVSSITPSQAMVGDLPFTITVTGSGFVQGSTVLWNGETRETGYVSNSVLTGTVRGADVSAPGLAYVTVINPGADGLLSPTAGVFTITNPAPVVGSVDPRGAWAGSGPLTVAVLGSGFTRASVVQVSGIDQRTTFVSGQRLDAVVPAEALLYVQGLSVRVYTPTPGGGLSAPVFLWVYEDNISPVTSVQGLDGLWYRWVVKFALVAQDGGRGVENTFWRIGRSGDYKTGTEVSVPAPKDHSFDGLHVVQFFSVDKVLNFESPPKEVQVGIDTRPPSTSVAAATVKQGSTLVPKYLVYDALSPRARDAVLQVIDARGKVVLRYPLGKPATRTWVNGSGVVVSLPKGVYKMRVLAHDLAGNAQSSTKSGVLRVK